MRARPTDPIFVEVAWNRLIAVVEQEAQALLRTAFTHRGARVRRSLRGVFDTKGRMIAQAVTGTPGHINSMALAVEHVLAAFPAATLAPGDVLVTNDPWLASGHLHDITVVTPIFHRGRLIAGYGKHCHATDIGGRGCRPTRHRTATRRASAPDRASSTPAASRTRRCSTSCAPTCACPTQVIGDLYAQSGGQRGGGRSGCSR